jgi:hypothetical protein
MGGVSGYWGNGGGRWHESRAGRGVKGQANSFFVPETDSLTHLLGRQCAMFKGLARR